MRAKILARAIKNDFPNYTKKFHYHRRSENGWVIGIPKVDKRPERYIKYDGFIYEFVEENSDMFEYRKYLEEEHEQA